MWARVLHWLSLATLLHMSHGLPSIPLSAEKRLIKDLLARYAEVTTHGRPVVNISTPVDVLFGLGLIQMDLDEKAKALSMSLWMKMSWKDHYLTWDPTEYENVSEIRLDSQLLWIPDVMLYNTAETETLMRDTFSTVHSNGTVSWVPHQRLKSSCSLDVTNFPFDTQQCHMWFGSWTYTTKDLNLSMAFESGIDLSTYATDFKDSSQWEILDLTAERKVLPNENQTPNYAVLTYTLELRRNVVFSSYILTLPCVFLACLTLVVFWLPPDRPDRTSLAMSIFSSFLLLLLILVESAPPTASSVPLLGIYYCFNMVIIMLAIFLSSLVVNVCRMGEGRTMVPNWLKKLTINSPLRRLCYCEGLIPGPWMSEYNANEYESSYGAESEADGISCLPLISPSPRYSYSSAGSFRASRTRSRRKAGGCGGGGHRSSQFMGGFTFNGPISPNGIRREDPPVVRHEPTSTRHNCPSPLPPGNSGNVPEDIHDQLSWNVSMISDILQEIEVYMSSRSSKDATRYKIRREWRQVSLILDRVFFCAYLLVIALSIATLFPRP